MLALGLLGIIVLLLAARSVKVLRPDERGVVFRLGRALPDAKGPGAVFTVPFIDRLVRVSVKPCELELSPMEMKTRDEETVRVQAAMRVEVTNAVRAYENVSDFLAATRQLAESSIRKEISHLVLDQFIEERRALNVRLEAAINEGAARWGLRVSGVEVTRAGGRDNRFRAANR
ncbi:MAG TPA: hypothetical protein DEH78_04005 [Solibacterales bacterium]|nr:hypothetical protein [Bryobacterales bacterium]